MSEAYIFPLSFAQQRLWFLDQISPKDPSYNITTGIEMNFPIQLDIANRSLNELIQRHEVLRVRFISKAGKPYQLVSPRLNVDIRLVDIANSGTDKLNDTLQVMINQEMRIGFDLEAGPLLRVKIIRLAEAKNIFLISMHHIISDGWSIGLFFQEFRVIYEAFSKGQLSPLKELPIQYADYCVWQRNWLKGETLDKHLNYWKTQLANLQELQLETDFPRPPMQSHQGNYLQKVFSDELMKKVDQLARAEGATLFMCLLSAFYVLLHHYTRQTDLVIGTPIAGRNRRELEGLIGFFVNNVVFRADLSGTPSFRELLVRVRKMTLDAYANQDLPFEKLVEELNLERDLSKNPIFQVTFQLINTPTLKNKQMLNGASEKESPEKAQNIQKGTAMFDIAVDLIQVPDGMMVQMEYSTDLFHSDTIEQMIEHYEILLESIIENPEATISELSYFKKTSPKILANKLDIPSTPFIHQLFEKKAAERPEAIALINGDQSVSFETLNRQANQLAHHLIRKGVGPEQLVGISLPDSLDMILSMLAVLKTGAAYTPIDPNYPIERLKLMADKVDLLLTTDEINFILGKRHTVLNQEEWKALFDGKAVDNPNVKLLPQSLAYVLFTSGSTGIPKGVMISHAALTNHMNWLRSTYPLKQTDRVLQRTSFSFDASVWEIYAPLTEGAQLVLTDQEKKNDSHYLAQMIENMQVTTIQMVPSLLSLFHELGLFINKTSLKRVFCGGEALTAELNNQIIEQYPDLELINLYGPTESTIDATYWPCKKLDTSQTTAPIGQAIDRVEAYILDPYLNEVPTGLVGEIYLSGDSLGRGYYQMPKTTAERFLPNPFSKKPGARMYKTGDLGKRLADGNIQFKGRTDHQIKLRGYRIELGEIAAVLQKHAGITNAVVVLTNQEIVTYYTSSDSDLDEKELFIFLKDNLPTYMIPALLVKMEQLPMSPNGKIDRKALPEPRTIRENALDAFVAPEQPIELLLSEIWTEILSIPNIGMNHNFFKDLGGHSLLATQLISRVRKDLNVEIPLQRIFEFPTLGTFAEIILEEASDREQVENMASLLMSVNQMSEEELDRLLAED